MESAVWHGRRDVRVEDVADPPDPNREEVIVKVSQTGICGTDLHEFVGGPIFIPPDVRAVVLGHETMGKVYATGAEVRGLESGQRVAVIPHRVCRQCHYCKRGLFQFCEKLELIGLSRPGAFAPYVLVREDQIVPLPDSVSDDAAAMIEPLAVVFHALKLPEVQPGASLLIVGGGPIGLCAALGALALGVADVMVVEQLPRRRALASELGVAATVDPGTQDPVKAARAWSGGSGVDVAIECVGATETMNLAIRSTRPRGLTVLMGIAETPGELDLPYAHAHEQEVRGCIGYFEGEFPMVVDLLAGGRLDPRPLITHKISLRNIVTEGFLQLIEDRDSCVKVLVSP